MTKKKIILNIDLKWPLAHIYNSSASRTKAWDPHLGPEGLIMQICYAPIGEGNLTIF